MRLLTTAIITLLCALFSSNLFGQNVIGYMPYWSGNASDIQYTKLTHINYSFAIPDVDGHLKPLQNTTKLQQIVQNAHAVGGKVLIAVGGWSENGTPLDSRFETIGANAQYRTNLVNDIVALVNQYNLDGADMDWEFPDAGSSADNFEALMTELYNALHPSGKLVTAAVSGSSWGGQGINSTVKNVVDWLNIMAYDFNDYDHSTFADAQSAVQYYQNKGFPNSQLALGVPFYARPSWESYASIVGRGADPYQDIYSGNGYNGITTIKQKTNYVINNGLRGVMIWEISQDLFNQYSLVTAIDEEINANGNQLPTVSLTSPSNGASYVEGDNISLTATASDADGSVTKVEFYNGSTKLGEDLTSPYSYTVSNVTAGSYDFKAIATDNSGGSSTSNSASVTVTIDPTACNFGTWNSKAWYNAGDYVVYNNHAWLCVNRNRAKQPGTTSDWSDQGQCGGGGSQNQAPSASISSPSNNASFTEGSTVSISANATDADGSVTLVEFYANGSKIGQDATSPYTFDWTNTTAGSYDLTVKSTDNEGATTTSSKITITITSNGGGGGSNCDGVSGHNSKAWYNPGDQCVVNNTLYECVKRNRNDVPPSANWSDLGACGQQQQNQLPTASITSPSGGSQFDEGTTIAITASAVDADGSVSLVEFYADGVKIGQDATNPYSFNWSGATVGSHSLTVKATDNDGASTTSAAVSITVNQVAVNQAPSTSITSPSGGSQFDEGTTITINANASDVDGTVSLVEFYANGIKIGQDATSPYSFNWSGAAVGSHSLTVKATDNDGATTTSATVSVNVNQVVSNQAPTASITSPSEGASFNEGSVIGVTASASDADGSVSKVQFYVDGSYYGEDLTSPYSIDVSGLTAGSHTISVIATDNDNAQSASDLINVTVNAVGGGCSEPQYAEGNTYNTGDDIQNNGNLYDCTVGGWCSGAAWAYEPGVGLYWTEAWTLIRSCSSAPQARKMKATVKNSPETTVLNVVVEESQMLNVTVYNTLGQVVFSEAVSTTAGGTNLAIDKTNWNFGYYVIQVAGESSSVQIVINK